MRVGGHNALAVVVAAIAIYAIEFLIYGVAVPAAQFQQMAGLSDAQVAASAARMPLGALMPLMAAIGISMAIRWRGSFGLTAGALTALPLALLIAFSSRLYGYVYGADSDLYLMIELGRYVVTYAVAGGVIGAWR